MRNLIEKIFKREKAFYNYVIGEYYPSRGQVSSKPARTSAYDVEPTIIKDEMEIDNIYKET
jgi:hypothetical protein